MPIIIHWFFFIVWTYPPCEPVKNSKHFLQSLYFLRNKTSAFLWFKLTSHERLANDKIVCKSSLIIVSFTGSQYIGVMMSFSCKQRSVLLGGLKDSTKSWYFFGTGFCVCSLHSKLLNEALKTKTWLRYNEDCNNFNGIELTQRNYL